MRITKIVQTAIVVCIGVGYVIPVAGQQRRRTPLDVGALSGQMQREMQRKAALDAINVDRSAVVNEIIITQAPEATARFGDDWRDELHAALMRATPEQLLQARSAREYDDVVDILFNQRPALSSSDTSRSLSDGSLSLGSFTSDLVYFPVAPCRLLDTRITSPYTHGVTRSYFVNGDMSAQGGSASGCGIPVDPAAVAINVSVTQATGVGFLTLYAYTSPLPGASTINFSPGSELANTTIVPVCQLCGNDISMSAGTTGATHVVADIVGYFWSPTATALDVITVTNSAAVVSQGFFNVTASCPVGRTLTGGGFFVDSPWADGIWLWGAGPDVADNGWLCTGANGTGDPATAYCFARCARVPGR